VDPTANVGEVFEVPSDRKVRGRLVVPASKSVTQRYFNLALLGRLPLTIRRPLLSEDTLHFLAGLEVCGFRVDHRPAEVRIEPGALAAGGEVFCGAGGTMFRFLTAALTAVPGHWRLDGVPRLRERTVAPLLSALRQLGAEIACPEREGFAPLEIVGGTLRGGRARLDAGASSQFLSAILMAAQRALEPTVVELEALTSQPYVDLTVDAIAELGGSVRRPSPSRFEVRPSRLSSRDVEVEADFSAAAYPAAAAALTGGEVELEPLRAASKQGDRRLLGLLEQMGARVRWTENGVRVAGGELRSIDVDLSALPDQVPTVAALAPFAAGTTRIRNVPHLRIKESDRLSAMAQELARAGAEVEELADGLVIPGVWARTPPLRTPVEIDTHGDHRIAMSMALVGLRRPGLRIREPGVVAKSYPDFWKDLCELTGR
jgi:3-phosphoshikimate 1-carboxyvinyltransferase